MIRTALIAAAVLASVPAFAAPATTDGAASITVSFADLDLGSAAGRNALHGRLERAAQNVCQDVSDGTLANHAGRACRQVAMAGANERFAALTATGRRQMAVR